MVAVMLSIWFRRRDQLALRSMVSEKIRSGSLTRYAACQMTRLAQSSRSQRSRA
jgi:hypothetical protein